MKGQIKVNIDIVINIPYFISPVEFLKCTLTLKNTLRHLFL